MRANPPYFLSGAVRLTSGRALSLAEVRVLVPGSAIRQYYYAGGDQPGSTSATTCGTGCGTAGALLAKQLYHPFGYQTPGAFYQAWCDQQAVS